MIYEGLETAKMMNRFSLLRHEQPDRGSCRYREKPVAIRELQSCLLYQAGKAHIPIIANGTIDDTVRDVLLEVNRQTSEPFPPGPGIPE